MLHNDKTLAYIEHVLYRLDKTKMIFKNYCLINAQLLLPANNYLKFHAMSYFIEYICRYKSIINYDTVHSEIAHKYLLKVFYGWTNNKEYKSQIL